MNHQHPIPVGTAVLAYSRTHQTKEFGKVMSFETGASGDGRSRTGVRLTRRQLAALKKKVTYVILFQGREVESEERVNAYHHLTGSSQVNHIMSHYRAPL